MQLVTDQGVASTEMLRRELVSQWRTNEFDDVCKPTMNEMCVLSLVSKVDDFALIFLLLTGLKVAWIHDCH